MPHFQFIIFSNTIKIITNLYVFFLNLNTLLIFFKYYNIKYICLNIFTSNNNSFLISRKRDKFGGKYTWRYQAIIKCRREIVDVIECKYQTFAALLKRFQPT